MGWIAGLAASLAVAIGLGLGVALARGPMPLVLRTVPAGGLVSVVAREFEDLRNLAVVPEIVDQTDYPIRAPGVIRGVDCVVGDPVISGTRIATVDANPILALRLSRPLWRDLWPGSSGDDVRDLQRELRRLGFDVKKDGRYDAAVSTAIATLWERAGVSQRKTFVARSDILWLQYKSVVPSECLLRLGDEVSSGDVAMRSGGGLVRLSITVPDAVTGGTRDALLGDRVAPISDDSTIEDPDFLAAFSESKAFLTYKVDDPNQQLTVETRLAMPIQVIPVPATSLYAIKGIDACVTSDSGPLAVMIVASELGETLVSAQVLPNEVAMYPDEDAAPCR
jgi:peptidoglycan hydrolase-like protein with peptidoglycan-binding domain